MSKLSLLSIPRVGNVKAEDFRSLYMETFRPVIIKDLASSWPASRKWTPEYLKKQYGDLQVKVHNASYVRPGTHYMSSFKKMPFKEYLDLMTTSSIDLRMFAFNIVRGIPELKEDIQFPPIASGYSKKLVHLFFGCKGSVTPMHYDIDMRHVFHTVIYGKKRIVLFPNEESKNLYQHPFNTRSYVNVDNPDFNKFPRLKNVTGYEAILDPGETLFIPSGFWHHTTYEESGYGVSLRCAPPSLARRLRGYVNIFWLLPIDKIMNKLLSDHWFRWKERRACRES